MFGANMANLAQGIYEMLPQVDDGKGPRRRGPNGAIQYQLGNGEWVSEQRVNELMANEKKNLAQGLTADGTPIKPAYESLIDPATGQLYKHLQVQHGQIDPSKMEGYQAFKDRALKSGQSDWATTMLQKLDTERMGAIEKASAQGNAAQAQARSGLAMRGGLSSGARERIASQGMKDVLAARQGIGRQNTINRLGILSTDEETRNKFLSQLPGMEADIQKFNIGVKGKQDEFNLQNVFREKAAKDAYNEGTYAKQLEKWGAERQAQATESSGSGGSWVCTKIHEAKPLSGHTRAALFLLRKYSLREHEAITRCYLYECSELTERMQAAGVNWNAMSWFTDKITKLVEDKKMHEAFEFYTTTMIDLIKKFWPDTKNETLRKIVDERVTA